jgi:hypothetical protein
MMTFPLSSRRAILIGGFTLAVAAAPLVGAVVVPAANAPTAVADCPAGYTLEPTSGSCVIGGDEATPEAIAPANPGLPQVDGIPCTGANSGQCIGLEESQGDGGPAPIP